MFVIEIETANETFVVEKATVSVYVTDGQRREVLRRNAICSLVYDSYH